MLVFSECGDAAGAVSARRMSKHFKLHTFMFLTDQRIFDGPHAQTSPPDHLPLFQGPVTSFPVQLFDAEPFNFLFSTVGPVSLSVGALFCTFADK